MRPSFALVHTWPELKNAEYEVLQRVLTAAERCEIDVVVIDNNGKILWASERINLADGEILDGKSVDFSISLHFESPKVIDAYSYITLWQPISFYMDFGYQKSIDKISTHNDLLSCASDIADAHGLNLMSGIGRTPIEPLIKMFHTLPEPYLEPDITKASRLFYIGINWERLGRPKGRFHDALISLDNKGLVDIFGPEEVFGVAPWEGFESYQGELPFDGESVKYAINRSGICLALSSLPHKNTGIMSNRLFEGLAGGAAIIATPNPLIDKYFKEVVYLVDDSRGEQILGQQILDAVWRIRGNPGEARRRTLEGQRIMRESCSLEASLIQLVAETPKRIAHHEANFLADARVSVCLVFRSGSRAALEAMITQLSDQKRVKINLHILCDEDFARRYGDEIANPSGSIASVEIHALRFTASSRRFDGIAARPERSGPRIAVILKQIDTPYFAILHEEDGMFSDHFASLAKSLEVDPSAMFACSGMLVDSEDALAVRSRKLDSSKFTDLRSILLVTGRGQSGRFLYRSTLIGDVYQNLFEILDGQEEDYFRLAALLGGPLQQTNYSTYILNQNTLTAAAAPSEPIEFQRQYVRDLFARNGEWLKRVSAGGELPHFIYAYAPGVPVNWADQLVPAQVRQRIQPNTRLMTAAGGDGIPCLTGGFSPPEADFSWIASERGVIEFSIEPDKTEPQANYEILLDVTGRRSIETGREQHCTFALNGKVIAYHRVPEARTMLRLAIPMQPMGEPPRFRLEIVPDHADQVYDALGNVIDPRRLSVCLMSIELRKDVGYGIPTLVPGTLHACTPRGEGALALFTNFYPPEENFSWIAGTQASLRFALSSVPKNPVLRIHMEGRVGLESGASPEATFVINGTNLGTYSVPPESAVLTMKLGDACGSGNLIRLIIDLSHAEAVFDEDHKLVDSRLLGAAVRSFGIFAEQDIGDFDMREARI